MLVQSWLGLDMIVSSILSYECYLAYSCLLISYGIYNKVILFLVVVYLLARPWGVQCGRQCQRQTTRISPCQELPRPSPTTNTARLLLAVHSHGCPSPPTRASLHWRAETYCLSHGWLHLKSWLLNVLGYIDIHDYVGPSLLLLLLSLVILLLALLLCYCTTGDVTALQLFMCGGNRNTH